MERIRKWEMGAAIGFRVYRPSKEWKENGNCYDGYFRDDYKDPFLHTELQCSL